MVRPWRLGEETGERGKIFSRREGGQRLGGLLILFEEQREQGRAMARAGATRATSSVATAMETKVSF